MKRLPRELRVPQPVDCFQDGGSWYLLRTYLPGQPLPDMKSLRSLSIGDLESLRPLRTARLESLSLLNGIGSLEGLERLENLDSLNLEGMEGVSLERAEAWDELCRQELERDCPQGVRMFELSEAE